MSGDIEREKYLLQFQNIFPPHYTYQLYKLTPFAKTHIRDLYSELSSYKLLKASQPDSLQVKCIKLLIECEKLFPLLYAACIGKLKVQNCDYRLRPILSNIVRWGLRDIVLAKWREMRKERDVRAGIYGGESFLTKPFDLSFAFGFVNANTQVFVRGVLIDAAQIERCRSESNFLYENAKIILSFYQEWQRGTVQCESRNFNLFNLVELFDENIGEGRGYAFMSGNVVVWVRD